MKRFTALLLALEPIAHGDTQTGIDNATNVRLFMRSGLYAPGSGIPSRVPDISENALRAVLFRKPLADDLLDRLGIPPRSLAKSVVNLLYAGGNMVKGAVAPSDQMTLGHAVKSLYPCLDLLGGAVDSFILPPGRLRLCCWPVAREYAPLLRYVAPAEVVAEAEQVSVYDLLFEETRVRGTGAEAEGNQMLYSYETLAAGAKVFVEVVLDANAPPATVAATGFALRAWDGFIGGQGRQGRGRMAVLDCDFPVGDAYLDHLRQNASEMRRGLESGSLGVGKVLCSG